MEIVDGEEVENVNLMESVCAGLGSENRTSIFCEGLANASHWVNACVEEESENHLVTCLVESASEIEKEIGDGAEESQRRTSIFSSEEEGSNHGSRDAHAWAKVALRPFWRPHGGSTPLFASTSPSPPMRAFALLLRAPSSLQLQSELGPSPPSPESELLSPPRFPT